MHQIFAAFFALLISFGHAAPAPHSEAFQPAQAELFALEYAPSRQELAQAALANRYAGSVCLSCRRTRTSTTVSSRVR